MPKNIVWSPLAEKDFENILIYLRDNWNEMVLDNFIDITDNMIFQILSNPKQFPLIHKKIKVRKCVLTKHNTLFYRVRRDAIEILRIYDTRQDPDKLEFK